MKIAILGTGIVGRTLAEKFVELGHDVVIGTRNVAEKLASDDKDPYGNPPFKEWHSHNRHVQLKSLPEAAASGEMVVNALQGAGSIDALKQAEEKNLSGKVIIDVSNPLDFSKGMPPGLIPELSNTNSLGEEIQRTFPDAKVVKTLNNMWCGLMVNPGLIGDGNHTVFISGNDSGAKDKVKSLLNELGWKDENILDLGDISTSRGTEGFLPAWLRIFSTMQHAAFNFKVVS
jgi:8-hydroxy-5-deazaflavin:NADPH oxidoreductase